MSLSVSLRHAFPGFELDVSFEAPAGVTALFGRSGSGKSTVVNAVAGLFRPAAGRISLNGETLLDTSRGLSEPPHRRRLGYVFQEGRLFPHLTVRQNLLYGRRFAPAGAGGETLGGVAELLGLERLLDRRPGSLSGGERQRVAIGRALLAAPRMILADEPLSALDEARKAEILPYLERLRDETGLPMLYVSHTPSEVARMATTVVALEDGRVQAQGPAAEVLGGMTMGTVGMRGAGAVLAARVVAHHADGLSELDAGGVRLFLPRVPSAPGSEARVWVAAREVLISRAEPDGLSALNVLPGTVEALRPEDGASLLLSVRTPAGAVYSRVTRRSVAALGLREGTPCFAVVKTLALARGNVGEVPGARGGPVA